MRELRNLEEAGFESTILESPMKTVDLEAGESPMEKMDLGTRDLTMDLGANIRISNWTNPNSVTRFGSFRI